MLFEMEAAIIVRLKIQMDMALLTEGECYCRSFYKHGPPNGGRMLLPILAINIALLMEGQCYCRSLL